ncbi:MAG: antibiotic biosynthesis monooxygenase [Proteobacteria bacterium]|nr:MAG: antibiotic biosynthesis monooxygenase [Pseudomonadota bacterium]
MIAVIGSFRIPVDRLAEARPMMASVIAATRAEPGCLAYSYAEDVVDPGLIRVSEQWKSREHLAAHFRKPHMAAWSEQRALLGLSERRIHAYSLSDEEQL